VQIRQIIYIHAKYIIKLDIILKMLTYCLLFDGYFYEVWWSKTVRFFGPPCIFVVSLHLLIFTVDVDYSLLTHAGEIKILRLPSHECLCKCFGDFSVLSEFSLCMRRNGYLGVPVKNLTLPFAPSTSISYKTGIFPLSDDVCGIYLMFLYTIFF